MSRFSIVSLCLALLASSRAPANTFLAQGSFPGDTRAAVTQRGAPWRCIGRLSLPDHRFMTATLVGPNLILTAAHGLVRDGRIKPGGFVFHAAAENAPDDETALAHATRAWLGSFTPDQEAHVPSDWAILQLDKKLGDVYGTLPVEDDDDRDLAGNHRRLYLASYDRDFEQGQVETWQADGSFVALNPIGYLLHDFSTDHGASGAPIFYTANWSLHPGARIIALNVAEKTPAGETLYRVAFAPRVANVAVASYHFYGTLTRILAGHFSDPSVAIR